MTTPARAAQYDAQYRASIQGKGYAVYNPHDKPLDQLPAIYGYNNGGTPNFGGNWTGLICAEDGTDLGQHICSNEHYMLSDLGILEGTSPSRHATFQKHYPDGYRMEFVSFDAVRDHPVLWPIIEAKNAAAIQATE